MTKLITPTNIRRVKRITSHTGHFRFMDELSERPIAEIRAVPSISSPYSYSATWPVYRWKTRNIPVFIRETSHKVYDVFTFGGALAKRAPTVRLAPKRKVAAPKKKATPSISVGDRITIVNRFGQQSTGRVVMRSTYPGSWVLNMGGRYGTPGIATPQNIVKVQKARKEVSNRSGGFNMTIRNMACPVGHPTVVRSGTRVTRKYGRRQMYFCTTCARSFYRKSATRKGAGKSKEAK
jgi:hypothetical protein